MNNFKLFHYTIKLNRKNRTYTIRKYSNNGKLVAKYRSYPQGKEFSEDWTEHDIVAYLRQSIDYYQVY